MLSNGYSRVVTGSYTGSNNCGALSPTSLTFEHPVKFLWVFAHDTDLGLRLPTGGNMERNCVSADELTTSWVVNSGIGSIKMLTNGLYSGSYGKKSADGKTISWYNTDSAAAQYNDGKYYYIAILE